MALLCCRTADGFLIRSLRSILEHSIMPPNHNNSNRADKACTGRPRNPPIGLCRSKQSEAAKFVKEGVEDHQGNRRWLCTILLQWSPETALMVLNRLDLNNRSILDVHFSNNVFSRMLTTLAGAQTGPDTLQPNGASAYNQCVLSALAELAGSFALLPFQEVLDRGDYDQANFHPLL